MLLRVGRGPTDRSTDLVGSLRDCHERIRFFCDLAGAIAKNPDAPAKEIAEAARRVRRYFLEAFPLHVADEEETLVPLLAGRDPAVDRALARMRADHDEHAPLLADLLARLEPLEHESLAASAERLREVLLPHLAEEEAIVFPALALLSASERARARDEIRRRRNV
jgi:iron-sulfur cluster repair protein YtfE (RIC family)